MLRNGVVTILRYSLVSLLRYWVVSITGFSRSGHKFDITENGEEVSYEAKFRLGFGVAFDLYRNGDVVLESPKYGFWRLVLTLSLIVLFIKLMERYL